MQGMVCSLFGVFFISSFSGDVSEDAYLSFVWGHWKNSAAVYWYQSKRGHVVVKLAFIGKARKQFSVRNLVLTSADEIIVSPDREIDRLILRFARFFPIKKTILYLKDYDNDLWKLEQDIIDRSDTVQVLCDEHFNEEGYYHKSYLYAFDQHKARFLVGTQFPRSIRQYWAEE